MVIDVEAVATNSNNFLINDGRTVIVNDTMKVGNDFHCVRFIFLGKDCLKWFLAGRRLALRS